MQSTLSTCTFNRDGLGQISGGHQDLEDQYNTLKNIQMDHLRDLLTINETGIGQFYVLGIEAGIGKSLGTNNAIGNYLLKGGTRKFLLAKKFKTEITDGVSRINNAAGKTVAMGITGDTWGEDMKGLDRIPKFPVVIITHKRYLDLCLDPKTRAIFEQGRHTLVIDEQIEPPTYSFSEDEYLRCCDLIRSRWLIDKLSVLCSGLFDEIALGMAKSKSVIACRPVVDPALLQEFRSHVIANKSKVRYRNIKELSNEELESKGTVKALTLVKEFLEMLNILGSSLCFSYQGRITAIDSRLKLWSLQNNIILDASAGIDRLYDCSPNMTVDIQPRIINNGNSVIRVDKKFSTSRGSIRNALDYPEKICASIRKCKPSTDNTLVVVHKDKLKEIVGHLKKQGFEDIAEGDDYNGQDIAITYYGNLIGKNHWRDFNQVWIVATNILHMELYPVYQHFFSQIEPVNKEILMDNVPGGFGFIEEQYEEVRIGSIAKDIYQAIKRIDRNEHPCSEIFLVQSNQLVIDEVIKCFPGIQTGEPIDLNIHSKRTPRKESQNDIKAAQMASLLLGLPPGNYAKKYMCELLGWNRRDPNLNRIWKHDILLKMDENKIIHIGQRIVTRF